MPRRPRRRCGGSEFDVRGPKPLSQNLYSKGATDSAALRLLAESGFGFSQGVNGLYGGLTWSAEGGGEFVAETYGISIDERCCALHEQ